MKNEIDERKGLLSASQMARVDACPASFNLSKGIPSIKSEYSERGERLHKAVEELLKGNDEILNGLSEEDKQAVLFVLEKVIEIKNNHDWFGFYLEKRYTIDGKLTGRIDCVGVWSKGDSFGTLNYDIIDYKFGVDPVRAEGNPQLKAYALLLSELEDSQNVSLYSTYIIQPDSLGAKFTEKEYYKVELNELELDELLQRIEKNEYAESIGEHCQYCPAREFCKLQKENATKGIENMNTEIQTIAKNEITTENATKAFELIETYKQARSQADKFCEMLENSLIEYAKSTGDERFELKQGAVRKSYDSKAVADYARTIFDSEDEYLTAFKPQITDLIKMFAGKQGIKQTDARRQFEKAMEEGEHVQTTYNKPKISLKK